MLAEPTITYCRGQQESSDRPVHSWAPHEVDALTPLQIIMGPGLKDGGQPAADCHLNLDL